MDEGGVGEEYMGTGAAVVRDILLLSGAAESCGLPRPHAWVVPIYRIRVFARVAVC
jgi:hypothetical protein